MTATRVLGRATTAAALIAATILSASTASRAINPGEGDARTWPYWKTDLHAHSVVSGDATADPGIIADAAKARGFNAVFLTDHQAGSYNPIGGVIASHVSFEDDSGVNRQWDDVPSTPTATATAALSTEHVLHGTNAYQASVSNTGEAFGWIKRGPNLHSGQITMSFSVYPTRIDSGTGLYVSMSLGGDATIPNRESDGYTTADGTVLPDHSTTLVWQLGTPRVDSDNGTTRVVTHPLSYTLNTWNTYTVDVTAAINDAFPVAAQRPADLNALLFIKMAAASRAGGTATGWFDTLSIDAANAGTKSAQAAAASAADFVARNAIIHTWDTPTFQLNPGQEMGFNDHAQRLHYPITDPAQWEQFSKGVQGIPVVQASGFPAQLNHPGLPGGVTDDEAITTGAYGADLMEAVERGTNDVMIRDWDALLHNGEPLIGTWTSDAHRNATLGPAVFLQAPSLNELQLQHSLFEGRAFMAPVDFAGSVSFTPDGDGGSYPARYPLYRSADDALAGADLDITAGLAPGMSVVWLQDGHVLRSDPVQGTAYQGNVTLSLPAASTPVRAEVRRADGSRQLMTEPIMMRTVAGLPHGLSLHLERVSTPSGTGYTKGTVQGITGVSWDPSGPALVTSLANPAGSTVEQVVSTGSWAPQSVTIDGTSVPAASSVTALRAGSADGWAFEPTRHRVVVKATQSGGTGVLRIAMQAGSDTSPPTAPGLSALAEDAQHVSLSWTPSVDDTGVDRYLIRRNGVVVSAVGSTVTTYTDNTVTPDTSYTYAVQAEDAASNLSPLSTATVRTQPIQTTTLPAAADSYVTSTTPTTNFGTAKTIKADGSPDTRAYLRFTLPPPGNKLLSATLRLTSTAALSSGVRVNAVTGGSWTESGITYNNAPAVGGIVGSTGPLTAGGTASADITEHIRAATGSVSVAITNPSTTNASMISREGGPGVPQLVLTTSTVAPHANDLTITTAEDTPVSFVPSVSGGAGPLTCSVASAPESGSVWIAPDCSTGQLTPGTDDNGTTAFRYAVSDGTQTDTADVQVTITPRNDAPTIDEEELGAGTEEDTPVSLTLRGNDVDGDCPLSFQVVATPLHGSLGAVSAPVCSNGAATATVTYTPAAEYSGSDSLGYRVLDPSGAASAPASLDVSVTPVNDPPKAGPVSFSAMSAIPTGFTPAASDIDSASLTCAIGTPPSKGSASVAADCSSGTYTAGVLASGTDSFTYVVSDGTSSATGTVTVSINRSTSPPTASSYSVDTAQRDSVALTLSGQDPDGACPLSFTVVSGPSHGSLGTPSAPTCSSGSGSSSVLYTPAPGYAGSDAVTYRATDAQGETSAVATISITVTPPLIADGFESGSLSGWKAVRASVVTTTPRTGTYAVELDSTTGGPSYIKKTLPNGLVSTDTSVGIRLLSAPTSGMTSLVRLRGNDDAALLTVQVDSTRRLKVRNELTRVSTSSTATLPLASWVVLQVRVTTSGASSTVQLLMDGSLLLSYTTDLGTAQVGALQLGENAKGPTGRFLADDVRVTGQ